MSTTQPIKTRSSLAQFKDYYLEQNPNVRNSTLILLGLNTALRISDILELKWEDIYNEETENIRDHLEVIEQKTGKNRIIALNQTICTALKNYKKDCFFNKSYSKEQYLFLSQKGINKPIGRTQAYRIIRTAAKAAGLNEHISCHSLRKTFGYHAWKQGTPPALLMDIYNHSSYQITKRYLGIEQEERDDVYLKISL